MNKILFPAIIILVIVCTFFISLKQSLAQISSSLPIVSSDYAADIQLGQDEANQNIQLRESQKDILNTEETQAFEDTLPLQIQTNIASSEAVESITTLEPTGAMDFIKSK